MVNTRTWTDEELRAAVPSCYSIAQVLKALGVHGNGSYPAVTTRIKKLNISIEHMTGQVWNKDTQQPLKYNNEEYLELIANSKRIKSHGVRLNLIRRGFKEEKCELCNLKQWNGSSVPLELHHIDGDNSHNSIDNLQLLCCNCHAQTDNYCGRGTKKYKARKKHAPVSQLAEETRLERVQ